MARLSSLPQCSAFTMFLLSLHSPHKQNTNQQGSSSPTFAMETKYVPLYTTVPIFLHPTPLRASRKTLLRPVPTTPWRRFFQIVVLPCPRTQPALYTQPFHHNSRPHNVLTSPHEVTYPPSGTSRLVCTYKPSQRRGVV